MATKSSNAGDTRSGYTHCACRDCFDTTVSSDTRRPELCELCTEAGCDATGASDCARTDDDGDEVRS